MEERSFFTCNQINNEYLAQYMSDMRRILRLRLLSGLNTKLSENDVPSAELLHK